MKLVSLNAWGGREWDALHEWIPKTGADILCLQEVTRAPVPSPDWLHYSDPNRRLAQRADLFRDVSRLLPEHVGHFAPATRGMLRTEDGRHVPSEHGIAVWVRRHLALSHLVQDFVWGAFRADGWGAEPVPRALQMGRIDGLAGNGSVAFAHFHGLRHPAGKADTPERRAQSARLVSHLGGFAKPGEPLILAGDFNVLPDNPMFAELAALGLRDQIAAHGVNDTRTSLYAKPQRFADYLLSTPAVHIRSFDVPAEPEVSDHRPLILSFDAGEGGN